MKQAKSSKEGKKNTPSLTQSPTTLRNQSHAIYPPPINTQTHIEISTATQNILHKLANNSKSPTPNSVKRTEISPTVLVLVPDEWHHIGVMYDSLGTRIKR